MQRKIMFSERHISPLIATWRLSFALIHSGLE
jgi:hypothetical protein